MEQVLRGLIVLGEQPERLSILLEVNYRRTCNGGVRVMDWFWPGTGGEQEIAMYTAYFSFFLKTHSLIFEYYQITCQTAKPSVSLLL